MPLAKLGKSNFKIFTACMFFPKCSTATLSQRLLLYDALEATFRTIKLRARNKECPVCGDDPTVRELVDYEQFCGSQAHDKVCFYVVEHHD